MRLATHFVEVRPDTRNFKKDLQASTESDARDVGKILGQALAGGAFLAGAKRATDAASQLEQAVGGTAAVFGESQDAINDWAEGAAESAGLSERAARELTSSLGGLLKGFGFTETEAADLSITLATLGADLAATFGGKPEEAVQALGAALRGETDPLERFGIALNQTLVNTKAVELGLAASTSTVDQNAKAQATLALITERSADAQGQFAREADTAAGQAAIAAAKTENAAADLGENLLPIYTKIAETVGTVATAFGALPEPVQTAVIALAGIAALAGPVTTATKAIAALAIIAKANLASGLETAGLQALYLKDNLGKAAIGAGALGAAVVLASIVIERSGNRAEAAADAVKGYRDAIEEAGNVAEGTANQVAQFLKDNPDVVAALNDLDISSESLATALGGTDAQFSALLDRINEGASSTGPFNDELQDLAVALLQQRDGAEGAAAEWAEFTEANKEGGDTAAGTTPKIEDQTEALSLEEQAAKDAAAAVDLFREAVEKALAPLDFEEAVDAQTQALLDLANDIEERERAVADARTRLAEVQDDPESSAAERAQAQQDLADAIAATSLSLEGNTEAALRNRDIIRDLTEGAIAVIEAGREEGKTLEELQFIREAEIRQLEDQLTQMGLNKDEIARYIDRIEEIPLSRETVLDVDTAKADIKLTNALARWQRQIDLNPLSVDVLIAERDLIRRSGNRGNAAGGSVMDGVFTVGEAGQETMVKDGNRLEVIAGQGPRAAGFDGVGEDQLLTQRQMAGLLRSIDQKLTGRTDLRRVERAGSPA